MKAEAKLRARVPQNGTDPILLHHHSQMLPASGAESSWTAWLIRTTRAWQVTKLTEASQFAQKSGARGVILTLLSCAFRKSAREPSFSKS